jgi:hypothetical protein
MRKCWDANSDGAGYMWAENGEVQIRKGFFKFKRFWHSYQADLPRINQAKSGVAIHFRISSSGVVDTQNCHPHWVNTNFAFIHNGILPLEVPIGSKVSDSYILSKSILQDLPLEWYKKHNLRLLMQLAIGHSNKIVFLAGDGLVTIINESDGEWLDGIWYSNAYWKYRCTYAGTSLSNPWTPESPNSSVASEYPHWGGYRPNKDDNKDDSDDRIEERDLPQDQTTQEEGPEPPAKIEKWKESLNLADADGAKIDTTKKDTPTIPPTTEINGTSLSPHNWDEFERKMGKKKSKPPISNVIPVRSDSRFYP